MKKERYVNSELYFIRVIYRQSNHTIFIVCRIDLHIHIEHSHNDQGFTKQLKNLLKN